MLGRELERFPIVALSSSEVRKIAERRNLEAIFYERHYTRDLFGLESPLVSDRLFFGRSSLMETLVDRLSRGQNSGIFGLRRIGKSSVLRAIERRARETRIASTYYRDLSASSQMPFEGLLHSVALDLMEEHHVGKASRKRFKASRGPYSRQTAAVDFSDDVERLLDHHSVSHRLVLLFDEIESITFGRVSESPHWDDDFLPLWKAIRALHQATQGRFTFVVAGVNPYALEEDTIGGRDNPLFSTVGHFYVKPFKRDTAGIMLHTIGRYMGVSVKRDLVDVLFERYGGHPFLLRRACSLLSKEVGRPGLLTTSLYEQHADDVEAELTLNAIQILNVLARWYPSEYEILEKLAFDDATSYTQARESNSSRANHIVNYGLVDDDGSPTLTVGIVHEALAQRRIRQPLDAQESRDLSDDDASLEIAAAVSLRRNQLEPRLRLRIREGLIFAHGQTRAAARALDALPAPRREALSMYSLDDLFGPDSPLYWNELQAIVDKHWDSYAQLFGEDKPKVLQWFNQVNACRRWDAHAQGQIDPEELAFLQVCFARLESYV